MRARPLRGIGGLSLLAVSVTAMPLDAQAARFTKSADGKTVHDELLHVTWLADANYPATEKFGLPIATAGAMTYQLARRWVAALNASNSGAGYLGHKNWTLPATPQTDATCTVAQGPHSNSFGFKCASSALGSLYYRGLDLHEPNTAVPMPPGTVGPFRNFQPYLYWSLTGEKKGGRAAKRENGDHAFSFNTGWQGANVSNHVMYVLPMIEGPISKTTPRRGTELEPSADGQTVFDPLANVTWLANANLAAEMKFGVAGIVADGAMSRTTADEFIKAMNKYEKKGYLGENHWQLPPTYADSSCSLLHGGYNCSGSPMGGLYYNRLIKLLGLAPGEPVVKTPDLALGPFHNVQPYLYWSCAGGNSQTVCTGGPAAPGFQWSFSFGNGFQGTDVLNNSLYVMVYAPDAGRPR